MISFLLHSVCHLYASFAEQEAAITEVLMMKRLTEYSIVIHCLCGIYA